MAKDIMIITPKNWTSFQHYKDRAPQWIKLHRALLDDYEFASLPVHSRALAPFLWLLASEYEGGRIAASLDAIAFRMRMTRGGLAEALNPLVEAGFFSVSSDTDMAEPAEQVDTLAQRIAKSNGFGSRHITDAVKREVWARDSGICCACGSTEDIEYDHKTPVSKGGTSDVANIQLLCRTCNRKKRTKLAAAAEQVATLGLSSRSPEKEIQVKEEIEEEKNSRRVADATPPRANVKFDEFWKEYPQRDGDNPRKTAEKKFAALVKTGVDPDVIIAGAKRAAQDARRRNIYGTPYVPQAIKWLNDQRFLDIAVDAFAGADDGMVEVLDQLQLEAWDAYGLQHRGKKYPRDKKGGWRFPSKWPPGYEPNLTDDVNDMSIQ